MEALAAFGVAASVLQVVDFSTTLLSSTKEIVKGGSTVRNLETNTIANDLQALNDGLKRSYGPQDGAAGPLSKDEQVSLSFLRFS